MFRDLLDTYCAYLFPYAIGLAPCSKFDYIVEGLDFGTGEVMEGINNLSKVDFLRSLAPDDPVIAKLKWSPPEDLGAVRKTQLLKYVEAADCILVPVDGMPFLDAHMTILQLCYETCTLSCNPDLEDRLGFLRKLQMRKNRYKKAANKKELETFDKLFNFVFEDSIYLYMIPPKEYLYF